MPIKKRKIKKKPPLKNKESLSHSRQSKKKLPKKKRIKNKKVLSKNNLRQEQIAKTQRHRRNRRKRNYTLYYIMLAIFLIVAGVTLSLTVFFNIESIEVKGSSIYTADDVKKALDAEIGDNLLRLNTKALSEDVLRQFEKADNVEVKRVFPTVLLVEIEDGVPTTQLYSDNKYYILSKRGRVLDILYESVPNAPIILGPGSGNANVGEYVSLLLENEDRDWIEILLKEIEKSKIKDISAIDISNTIAIKIYYQNRFEINLGSLSELDTKLAMVYSVLARGEIGIEEKGTIDITDPDRMYVDSDAEIVLEDIFADGWEWEDPHYEETTSDDSADVTSSEESQDSSEAKQD